MAGCGYEDIILYADTEFAGDVNARLDGNDLARLEFVFRFSAQDRQLVNFQADAVAQTVAEHREAGLLNYISCSGVNILGLYTFGDKVDGRFLGKRDGVVCLLKFAFDLTHPKAAGLVAVIALILCPEVDENRLIFAEFSFAGAVVRP